MAVDCRSLISPFPGMLLRYSQWFSDGSSRPCYYRYHFFLHIPHALNLYCKVFTFQNLPSFSLDHKSISKNCKIFDMHFPCSLSCIIIIITTIVTLYQYCLIKSSKTSQNISQHVAYIYIYIYIKCISLNFDPFILFGSLWRPPIGVQWLPFQCWYSCYIRLSVWNGWRYKVGTRATSAYRWEMVEVAMLVLVLHLTIGVPWLTLQCCYSCYIRLSVCNGWRCKVGTRATSAYRCAMVGVAMLVLVLHPPICVQWLTLQCWYSCYIRLSVCNGWRFKVGTHATSAYRCAIVAVPMLALVLHPPISVQ